MKIKISKDFSKAPGPRYSAEGKHSGEDFRTQILFPKLDDAIKSGDILTVDLDGTYGFGTSFLEESFGGLIRENGFPLETILATIHFVSTDEPDLIDEIKRYMTDAEQERIKS